MIRRCPARRRPGAGRGAEGARFGFEVKRLDHMNADIQNLKGTGAGDDPEQRPELDAMYKVLAQIPSKRIKGKISEMVDFNDADGGGVTTAATRRFISMPPHRRCRLVRHLPPRAARSCRTARRSGGLQAQAGIAADAASRPHLMHETAHAEDDGVKFMESRWNQPEFGNWREESPKSIAKVAAPHLGYDEDWICDVLKDPGSKPPKHTPKRPKQVKSDDEWNQRREKALLWCQSIRSDNNPWWKGSVCAKIQIGGRVYHEAYPDGRWRSYDLLGARQGHQRLPVPGRGGVVRRALCRLLRRQAEGLASGHALAGAVQAAAGLRRTPCPSSRSATWPARPAAPPSPSTSCTASTPIGHRGCAGDPRRQFPAHDLPDLRQRLPDRARLQLRRARPRPGIAVLPIERLARWREDEADAEARFERIYGPRSSPLIQSIGKRLRRRLAFGWAAIREKLVIDDLGLDDVTVELCKSAVLRVDVGAGRARRRAAPARRRRQPLHLAWMRSENESVAEAIGVGRELYDEIAADENGDWQSLRAQIGEGMFVDLGRLLIRRRRRARGGGRLGLSGARHGLVAGARSEGGAARRWPPGARGHAVTSALRAGVRAAQGRSILQARARTGRKARHWSGGPS
jgi:hypothetical protein